LTPDEPRQPGEQGYALIAAVISIIVFALMALTIINAVRGPTIMASAELDRARLSAAADAGIALAIQGLLQDDPVRRWKIDGKPRQIAFDGITLSVIVEDERGKIALNLINKNQVERMFSAFGLSGAALETAVDGFMDWRDENFEARPRGAERRFYEGRRIQPRNGELRSVGELALINGVGQRLASRIAPFATVNFGTNGDFDPRYATPLAIRVSADDDFDEVDAARQARGPVSLLPTAITQSLIGRPLTVRVDASRPPGAHARRQVILELTGSDIRPYVIRARE
jgi:general secretion pathway protein K